MQGEQREIVKLIAITLSLGLIAIVAMATLGSLFEGDLVIDGYEVELAEDGTLHERYVYEVKDSGEYRMLYRAWEEPLSFSALSSPSIELVDMIGPSGAHCYIKDCSGVVSFRSPSGEPYRDIVDDLAWHNEVGAFNPSFYDAGYYAVEYTFRLHPPLQQDGEHARLDLFLMTEHIFYRHVTITLPASMVEEVHVRPCTYSVVEEGDRFLITGSSPSNEPLTLSLLLTPQAAAAIDGFPEPAPAVKGTLAVDQGLYSLPFAIGSFVKVLATLLVLVLPFLFAGIWMRHGREQDTTVPEYLSYVPNRTLPPWKVNLVFKGDSYSRDEDGLYATLLDLHHRKNIKVIEKPGGKGVLIRVLNEEGLDSYEKRAVAFITLAAGPYEGLDTEELAALVKRAGRSTSARSTMVKWEKRLQNLISGGDKRISKKYGIDGRDTLKPLAVAPVALLAVSVLLILLNPDTVNMLMPAAFLSVLGLVQVAIAWHFPATLFGTWHGDYYHEKLEWDAFACFLSDLARIKEYAVADLPMWGDWLVYGTALGVGEKVERAMDSLNVDIVADAGYVHHSIIRVGFHSVGTFSSSGGGSGGGGGGFGGGGAGGR